MTKDDMFFLCKNCAYFRHDRQFCERFCGVPCEIDVPHNVKVICDGFSEKENSVPQADTKPHPVQDCNACAKAWLDLGAKNERERIRKILQRAIQAVESVQDFTDTIGKMFKQ